MPKRVRIHIADAPMEDILLPQRMEREGIVKILQKYGSLEKAGIGVYGYVCSLPKLKRMVWQYFCKVASRYDRSYSYMINYF